jgi:hypothetical protein
MATEIHQKFLSSFTVQASAAITADAYSGGTQTTASVAGASGNAEGAWKLHLWADVTVAPSGGVAVLKVYGQTHYADSDWDTDEEEYCVQGSCPDGETGKICLGWVEAGPYHQFRLLSEDYGCTASLVCVPCLPESQ